MSILDIKQGSELSTEYNKYGGISAEGGKTYDINYNSVILPNGSIVGDYKNVEKTENTITYEYVDLGLPSGLKWAKCNIGATSETDYGVFFSWGDTRGVSGSLVGKYSDETYSWRSYTHCNGSETTLTKYNYDSSYGTVDNKTTLEPEDDAATQIMGSEWRMPTKDEFDELLSGTTYEFTTVNDVIGWKFTSNTDTSKYIFIPAAGLCNNDSVGSVDSYGNVWSSSLDTSGRPDSAWNLCFDLYYWCKMETNGRWVGRSVRGVRK